jgi:hypothetical protein
MPRQPGDQYVSKQALLDTAFWIAVCVVVLVMAFSVLIMGIFATNSGNPTVTIAGLGVILGGPAVLCLMIIARIASRSVASRAIVRQQRTALIVTGIIYCIGVPTLVAGAWLGVRSWVQAPTYQEANIEVPNSIPVF